MWTEEQVKQWKAQHGELLTMKVAGVKCVLRKPKMDDLSAMARKAAKDPIQAGKNLVVECVLHPTSAEVAAAIDRRPGALVPVLEALNAEIGTQDDVDLGKL